MKLIGEMLVKSFVFQLADTKDLGDSDWLMSTALIIGIKALTLG